MLGCKKARSRRLQQLAIADTFRLTVELYGNRILLIRRADAPLSV